MSKLVSKQERAESLGAYLLTHFYLGERARLQRAAAHRLPVWRGYRHAVTLPVYTLKRELREVSSKESGDRTLE